MLKQKFSGHSKKFRQLTALIVVVIIAAVGTYLLTGSHAATPYASINADSGTLASGAAKQTCSGSTDGNCIIFNGVTSTGTGGGTTTTGGGGSNMMVGLNEAGWGTAGAADVAGAVKLDRLDQDDNEAVSDFSSNGLKVDVLFSGPYTTSGITSLNATTWVSNALTWYKAQCTPTECPMLEVLNEPGGTWFWGSDALSQANATAYANLVKATYTAFHTAYGASSPLILATYDGAYGSAGDVTFGQEWWSSAMSPYVDGIVVHPYGETNVSLADSAAGNRQLITAAHTATGKPIYVTEVGWPTAVGQAATGDSFQWPQADSASNANPGLDQCDNIYNFLSWTRSTGYVNAVTIFQYRDYGTNDFYGVETSGGTKKDSYYALKAAALNEPNPCPSAANGYALQPN